MKSRRASKWVCAPDQAHLWEHLRDLHPLEGAALLLAVGFRVRLETVGSVLGVSERRVGMLCSRGLAKLWAQRGGEETVWGA